MVLTATRWLHFAIGWLCVVTRWSLHYVQSLHLDGYFGNWMVTFVNWTVSCCTRMVQGLQYSTHFISVKRIDGTDEEGELYSYLETLGTNSITPTAGYDFSKEHRSIYTTGDFATSHLGGSFQTKSWVVTPLSLPLLSLLHHPHLLSHKHNLPQSLLLSWVSKRNYNKVMTSKLICLEAWGRCL